MLRLLLVALVVLPVCWASSCCSGADRKIVREQWYSAFNSKQSGKFKSTLGLAIFAKFLKAEPKAEEVLERVKPKEPDSPEFKAHTIRVLSGLDRCINLLDNQKALDADLDHLAEQHRIRKGVIRKYFDTFVKILQEVLPTVLTDYNADAWKSCLGVLSAGITAKLG